jgi:tetratricopeptide (TPR) repeat protein
MNISRPPVFRVIFAAAALGLFSCTRQSDSDLATQFSAEQRIVGDTPSVVSFDLEPGHYLVEAREQDIDVRLIVEAHGERSEIEDNVPRHGLHATVVRMEVAGPLRLELHNSEHRGKQGAVRLRVARWRRDTQEDAGARERAFAAFGEAGVQTHTGSKESWTRAADLLHEAIANFADAGDEALRAQSEYTLAHLEYYSRMEWQPAIRAAERAAAIYSKLDDRTGELNARTIRAVAELEVAGGMSAGTQGSEQRALYEAADGVLSRAHEYFTQQGLKLRAGYTVNMRGIRAFYEGQYEGAADHFRKAAELARQSRDPGEESLALANLAWMHYSVGRVTQASAEYEKLLPLIEKDRQPLVYVTTLGNYGLCLVALGDFDRAMTLHTEAISIAQEMHNDSEHARHLTLLGALYVRTGDMRRALETLRTALAIQERIGDTILRTAALRTAGNAASALNQHDLALEYLRKAVELDVNPHSSARARVLIASELRILGNLREAEAELKRAFESTNALTRASALEERGRLRLAQKRPADAIEDLREADRQLTALNLDFQRIETNSTLAQALLATKNIAAAREAADAAVSIERRIRVKSGNPEWRAHFLSARYSPYEMRIEVELAGGATPQASWHAFRTAEEVRARSLADLLAGSADRRGGTPDPEGDALRAQLTSQELRLEARIQKQDVDGKSIAELRSSIVEVRSRIDAHRLRNGSVVASESKFAKSLSEIQSRLPGDTAVLAYFVGDGSTHAWLLTRHELRHARLRGRAAMQGVTDAFVSAQRLRVAIDDEVDTGAALFGKLLAGVTERRMLIIPDGPLNGIPFAAIPIPGEASYLIDRFVIGYAPSLELALDGLSRRAPPSSQRVAIVSDPIYAPDDQRLVIADNRSPGNLRSPRAASPNNLTRLPYSALEARAVEKALGSRETVHLDGFDANMSRVLGLATENLSVLHFATHAIARKDLPEQSALYLTEYSREGGRLADSLLTANDIARTGLRADVVVLSGCATGDGGELRGEGVLGLAYGFLANGSGSVVAALWPIEDASTARFMNEFYLAYRDSGKTAESLRTAQLRTRDSAKSAVWSSFVVRANGFP